MAERLIKEVLEGIRAGRGLALVTVVSRSGDAPVSVGAKMIVYEDGETSGTLGRVELDRAVIGDALESLKDKASKLYAYQLREILEEEASPDAEVQAFTEILEAPPTLLMAGAGHIAIPLSRMGKILGFRVVVLDDRPDYASIERFPEADEVIADNFQSALRKFKIDQSTYIVLITRGHKHDELCLREVAASDAAYVGMIGSKRRVGTVLKSLLKDGYPKEAVERVYAPIGLDINAKTPEEIALAILAEIVKIKEGGAAQSMKLTKPVTL